MLFWNKVGLENVPSLIEISKLAYGEIIIKHTFFSAEVHRAKIPVVFIGWNHKVQYIKC